MLFGLECWRRWPESRHKQDARGQAAKTGPRKTAWKRTAEGRAQKDAGGLLRVGGRGSSLYWRSRWGAAEVLLKANYPTAGTGCLPGWDSSGSYNPGARRVLLGNCRIFCLLQGGLGFNCWPLVRQRVSDREVLLSHFFASRADSERGCDTLDGACHSSSLSVGCCPRILSPFVSRPNPSVSSSGPTDEAAAL